jgi:hypothetical protein
MIWTCRGNETSTLKSGQHVLSQKILEEQKILPVSLDSQQSQAHERPPRDPGRSQQRYHIECVSFVTTGKSAMRLDHHVVIPPAGKLPPVIA